MHEGSTQTCDLCGKVVKELKHHKIRVMFNIQIISFLSKRKKKLVYIFDFVDIQFWIIFLRDVRLAKEKSDINVIIVKNPSLLKTD